MERVKRGSAAGRRGPFEDECGSKDRARGYARWESVCATGVWAIAGQTKVGGKERGRYAGALRRRGGQAEDRGGCRAQMEHGQWPALPSALASRLPLLLRRASSPVAHTAGIRPRARPPCPPSGRTDRLPSRPSSDPPGPLIRGVPAWQGAAAQRCSCAVLLLCQDGKAPPLLYAFQGRAFPGVPVSRAAQATALARCLLLEGGTQSIAQSGKARVTGCLPCHPTVPLPPCSIEAWLLSCCASYGVMRGMLPRAVPLERHRAALHIPRLPGNSLVLQGVGSVCVCICVHDLTETCFPHSHSPAGSARQSVCGPGSPALGRRWETEKGSVCRL